MMSMTTPWSSPMTPIAAITLAVGSAEAQYIESATWDSNYGPYGAGPQTCAQLRFQGSGGDYETAFGSGRRSEVVLWQRILDHPRLLRLLETEIPPEYRGPGTWMHDALEVRDDWQSQLLRTSGWSPLS